MLLHRGHNLIVQLFAESTSVQTARCLEKHFITTDVTSEFGDSLKYFSLF